MPTLPLAAGPLLVRFSISQMDVPTRASSPRPSPPKRPGLCLTPSAAACRCVSNGIAGVPSGRPRLALRAHHRFPPNPWPASAGGRGLHRGATATESAATGALPCDRGGPRPSSRHAFGGRSSWRSTSCPSSRSPSWGCRSHPAISSLARSWSFSSSAPPYPAGTPTPDEGRAPGPPSSGGPLATDRTKTCRGPSQADM
jgi:hypothetical protein